jgi:nitrite reductase/ring-hydroxylating ferredoxin subunit
MGHPLEALSAYLDGELNPEDSIELERHLLACTVCQETLAGYRSVNRELGGLLKSIPVPKTGWVRVRRGKSGRGLTRVALAAGVMIAMSLMVPSVRAHVRGWFSGGLFSSRAEETAAKAAFNVHLPAWLPHGAKQLPALLSDPDETGRFQRVEIVWTGASEPNPDPFLSLSQQATSTHDLKELIVGGQLVDIGSVPAFMEERTWHEGSRLKRDVRVAWKKDDVTFFLQSGVLSSTDMLRIAREMKPTSPIVAQAKEASIQPGAWYNAGPVERFDIGSVTHFPENHFFLVRLPDGFVAFYDLDPHLRHRVKWDPVERIFVSPAHGERYTIDGKPVAGPAPRGLDGYPVKIVNGNINVDLGTMLPDGAPTSRGNSPAPAERPHMRDAP